MELENWLKTASCYIHDVLLENGYSQDTAAYLNLLVNVAVVLVLIFVLDYVLRRVIIRAFNIFSNSTKTSFDDHLAQSNFPKYTAHVIPFIIFDHLIPYTFSGFPALELFFRKATDIYLIILVVWIIRSIIKSTKAYLRTKPYFHDKPLDSYSQIVIMVVWGFAILVIFSELADQSIRTFLTTLGAASAILLLIFRDTILGFVASIQVSVNDMVRIGDWITHEKFGADGDVIEINLTTVKVQNFDNTITTLPTYSLISDSFKNWRGMQVSGGRRIRRAIYLKSSSVKFLSEEDLNRFSEIQAIKSYIDHRQRDIDKFNRENEIDKHLFVNGRNQTNLGIFRKYCDLYLNNHPAINKELMIMTRHLAPTPQGIPLEIYAFSADKRWENYERIMADIFEHIIAAVPYFDLEIFESPAGSDLKGFNG
ncbi:mechanosensitive ion channel family protein [Robertkochia solimangrovi]|uniref:mechanosensitive ion channel family protein n=1 Tax=Robertkochia solimangrovi TaxID=2213046 RepID=UPI00117F1A59|nr:mechanosensitive ion channel domain-containing protein [Robertkochia solimangrovi]TRZ45253.1 mechanosensitive ion channel family protein [Robertkochia solimangrovi]